MRLQGLLAAAFLIVGEASAEDSFAKFAAHDAASATVVDHSAYAAFLTEYVRPQTNGPNLVAYGAAASGKAALAAYVAALERVDPTALARDEAFVYWVNLYNAVTLKVVLDRYPVTSIRKIKSGPVSFGPWDKKLATVVGAPLSLNDIEHKILRAHFKDNRVHYAVNCASIGCPSLKASPWTAAKLDADLGAAARAFINSPRGVSAVNGKVTASSIYDWYRKDFGKTDREVLAHLAAHADPALAASLKRALEIDRYQYDWSLNEAAR